MINKKDVVKLILVYLVNVSALILWLFDILDFPFMEVFDTEIPINVLGWIGIFLILLWAHGMYEEDRDNYNKK